jgi:hypothetical protein
MTVTLDGLLHDLVMGRAALSRVSASRGLCPSTIPTVAASRNTARIIAAGGGQR